MRPIPPKLRKQLAKDPYMQACIWCGSRTNIEWEHSLTYGGRQINEWYAINPLCRNCHRGYSGTVKAVIKDFSRWTALVRGIKHLMRDYPKHPWLQDKKYLDNKFLCQSKI